MVTSLLKLAALTIAALHPNPKLPADWYDVGPAIPPVVVEDVVVDRVPQEDEPGWDCATMGNRSCGPVLTFVCETPPGPDGLVWSFRYTGATGTQPVGCRVP